MQINERRLEKKISKDNDRVLFIWCCVLLVLFGIGIWGYVEYHGDLYTADEINAQLCREIIAEDYFELEEREVPLDAITIVDIELVSDIVIAGYICSDNYATRYGDKGYLMFRPKNDGTYYTGECYHEYNPFEMWEKHSVTDAKGKRQKVSTIYGKEYIGEKEYFIFISDDPTLEKIYISNDDKFKQIYLELEIAQTPYMNIVEIPKMKAWHITFKSAEVEPERYVASFFYEKEGKGYVLRDKFE